jgi:hypothetical protein
MGGVSLKAHAPSGEEKSLSVIVNGENVGSTPYSGTVPVCAKIAFADESGEHPVDMKVVQGVVTPFDFSVPEPDVSTVAGESVPSNVEQPEKKRHTGLIVTFSIASALGIGAAVAGEIGAKHFRDRAPDSETEYKNRLETIEGFQRQRLAGIILGAVGLVGLGLSIAF